MYIVKLKNGNQTFEIYGDKEKLKSGSIVKGINSIDSFSFVILPSNIGYNLIRDLQTLVTVYNTNKNSYEYFGRVLYSRNSMSESGEIEKEVICESYIGFLCDSQQPYVVEQNWTVSGLLEHIINQHNSQVEDYKQFTIGEVTVTDANDNLYLGIQRDNTWKTLQDKLINTLGGEFRIRVVEGVTYLDYLVKIGSQLTTAIELSRNMKSISREDDPSSYISRLIPLGCKLKDDEGNDTEERLDITSVNNGLNYIESAEAVEAFGIKYGYVTYDDVTLASNLLAKGQAYLAENNKVQVKYSITALDLSLLGLDINDFDIYNYYPIKNSLLGIDDVARVIKKTVDIVEEVKSSIEVGDNFKTLSDLQAEQMEQIKDAYQKIESTKNELKEHVSNEVNNSNSELQEIIVEQHTMMINDCESIIFGALESYTESGDFESFKETVESQLQLLSDQMNLRFTETIQQIESVDGDLQEKFNTITKYFTFDINGLTIGQIDSPYKVVIDNDRYSMQVNGVEVLWMDAESQELHTPSITITNKLNLFGYTIEEDAEGNVNCEYTGGEN